MHLSHLLVRNFRLIEEASLALSPGIQLFLGLNAQGKTSLIEAIMFLSTSTSHRTQKEEELIRWNQSVSYLRGKVKKGDEELILECGLEKKRKVIKQNSQPLPRVGDLYGLLRTVLFAPEDLAIVGGSPQERRRYLDMAIAQLDPAYIPLLQRYRRALRQRNQVLKRLQLNGVKSSPQELQVWNEPFLNHAVEVIEKREEMIQELSPYVENYYAGLADDGPLQMRYSGAEDIPNVKESLQEKLERTQTVEIERGSTQIGPHRDDIELWLAHKPLSPFASQGQRRAAALALRLAQARQCSDTVGDSPVLLIDDVVYEMDNTRRERFWSLVDKQCQFIVTATDREHLGRGLDPAQVFEVDHGEIRYS